LLPAAAGACGNRAPEPEAAQYLERLGGVLEVELVAEPEPPGPAYPPRRALRIEIPRTGIDAGEFLELHGCDNGCAGRFPQQSAWSHGRWPANASATRWPGWPRCAGAVIVGRLAAGPRGWQNGPTAGAVLNALFAGEEMRIAAAEPRRRRRRLRHLLRGFGDHLDALDRGAFDQKAFEASLAGLAGGGRIGHARRSWAVWRGHLDAARVALDAEAGRVCRNGRPTPRSGYLLNVFSRYYNRRTAAEARGADARRRGVDRALAALAARLETVARPAFVDWYAHVLAPRAPGSEWSRTRRAVVEHARGWQRLLETCGIDPRAAVLHD